MEKILEELKKIGSKHNKWEIIDVNFGYTLLIDTYYGKLALFKKNKMIDLGKNFVSNSESNATVIGLSEYFNLSRPKLFYRKGEANVY